MEKSYLDNITYNAFKKEFETIKKEINSILELKNEELSNLKKLSDNIIDKTQKLFNKIEPDKSIYSDLLLGFYPDDFWPIDNFRSEFSKLGDNPNRELNRLLKFKKEVNYAFSYLEISEGINELEISPFINHNSILEKKYFLLDKLRLVFNNSFYSISKIFDANGIQYNSSECREIGEDLARRGYIQLKEKYGIYDDNVKISVKGLSYIERKRNLLSKKKKSDDISIKINKIYQKLERLGFGQEIIFEELEDIKKLHSKLNKKNWKEIVQGKLIDLGLSEILSKEMISEIYQILIDENIKFLK